MVVVAFDRERGAGPVQVRCRSGAGPLGLKEGLKMRLEDEA
jgi:hypothetical protein